MSIERAREWRVRSRTLSLDRPLLMGIVNVTPDSFSDGGLASTPRAAVDHALRLVDAGADIVDVGGESTRPGAVPVAASEERERVIPVVRDLAARGVVVSIDTMKATVARAALEAGAEIVNDVGGMGDPEMVAAVAEAGAGVVIVHMQGSPATMQDHPHYDDVVGEVSAFLAERAAACRRAGVAAESIGIDPGIGFGKTLGHNLQLIDRLADLARLGYPVVLGASRKGFLGTLLEGAPPERRDVATAAVTALAVERGASVLRVHDPSSSHDAARVAWAIVSDWTTGRLR